MMRKIGGYLVLMVIMMVLAACSNEDDQVTNESEASASTENNETVEVEFWHSMDASNGETLETLIDNFNESQDDIYVNPIYQGSYADSLTKLRTNLRSDSHPVLYQSNFISSGPIIDTEMVVPMQDFVEEDGYDLSQLNQNILGAYEMGEGELYAMPFNSSTLLLYYNKDMFEENGLDPEQPPETYEEFTEVAATLTDENTYGAAINISSYFIEQLITVQGAELVNNGNGRGEELPTESLMNSEEAIMTYTWWEDLINNGYMMNMGSGGHEAFLSEEAGITFGSTAVLNKLMEGSEGKFEVGTGFIPYPEDKEGEGGVSVGGGSLYIMDNKPEEEQQAAWEFVKYLMEPEQQGYWYINTGYFPVNDSAYELPEVEETLEEFPQFETAINQLEVSLENNAGSNAGKGPVIGIYPDMRTIIVEAMEEVVNDVKTPEEALNDAAEAITDALERYNQTVE